MVRNVARKYHGVRPRLVRLVRDAVVGAPPKDYRRERHRSLSHRCLHSRYYWPVMPETVRLFRAEVEQFRFVCYRTKVRFLAVTAWAAWVYRPQSFSASRLTAGALPY